MPETPAKRLSNTEEHSVWSQMQLARYREMQTRERLNLLKSGALDQWTEETRNVAIDLLGDKAQLEDKDEVIDFEPALSPLPALVTHSPTLDRTLLTAASGWLLISVAVTTHAFWLP